MSSTTAGGNIRCTVSRWQPANRGQAGYTAAMARRSLGGAFQLLIDVKFARAVADKHARASCGKFCGLQRYSSYAVQGIMRTRLKTCLRSS